jgi:hypothetical protein
LKGHPSQQRRCKARRNVPNKGQHAFQYAVNPQVLTEHLLKSRELQNLIYLSRLQKTQIHVNTAKLIRCYIKETTRVSVNRPTG